jgi:uncharacterized protein with PIN domain
VICVSTEDFRSLSEPSAAGKSKLTAIASLSKEAKAARCPECGGPLERKRFIDTWDLNNNPETISEDFYCSNCDVRWYKMSGPHDFYKEV